MGPTYTIYHRGTKPRGSSTFPEHFGFSWPQQHSHHHFLQKAHTLQPISTLGQQPLYHIKNSFFNTLAQRAKVVCTNQQALHKEIEHIRKALQACHFPPWALNTLHGLSTFYRTNLTTNTTSRMDLHPLKTNPTTAGDQTTAAIRTFP